MPARINKNHQPLFALSLTEGGTIMLVGVVDFVMGNRAVLFLGDEAISPPYKGCVVTATEDAAEGQQYYVMILREPELLPVTAQTIPQLTVRQPGQADISLLPVRIDSDSSKLEEWYKTLPAAQQEKIFSLIADMGEKNPQYVDICRRLQSLSANHGIRLKNACWLTKAVIYGECEIAGQWLDDETELLLLAQNKIHRLPVKVFQTDESTQAFIATAEEEIYKLEFESFCLTFISNSTFYAMTDKVSDRAWHLEFVDELKTRHPHQIIHIRENICQALLYNYRQSKPAHAAQLIKKLQHYVTLPPLPLVDEALPFNLYAERVIPVGDSGVFVSGWVRDAFNSLIRLEAVSDVGLVLDITDKLIRFPRPDVAEQYKNSPYGGYAQDHGFVAYAQLSDEQRELLHGMGELHGVWFRATLADGAVLDIIPESAYSDVFAARDFVLKSLPAEFSGDIALQQVIAPAALELQRLCMQQVGVKEVKRFNGSHSLMPEVSFVIPLYKRLEYLKPQVACFAADDELVSACEIVYVLDSPQQAYEVESLLRELCAIYPVAVTLVVMQRNSGYAAANNHGAAIAAADMLLFMNSDILPRNSGWLGVMQRFYDKQSSIGALAPKLLYEDGSLQHAGMVFARKQFPFWLNLHEWKGYAADYAPACIRRKVPAVTGACMMVDKSLFSRVGGFTTDYVIGDFEDSDLCLKLADAGYDSWYIPEVELYHLERQSVPLNSGYHGSHAWQVNARLHSERWDELITDKMREFEISSHLEMKKLALGGGGDVVESYSSLREAL